ncbi:MAG: tetratricopeptide repeat protein [Promethearchaeota archaeon]
MVDERNPSLAILLNNLLSDPENRDLWGQVANATTEENKGMLLSILKVNAPLLSAFMGLLGENPQISLDLHLSLEDMDSLESFIGNLPPSGTGEGTNGIIEGTDSVDELRGIDENENESPEIVNGAIHDDVGAIHEDGNGEKNLDFSLDDLEKDLLELDTADDAGLREKFEGLIKEANEKSYSFNEQDLSDCIDLYEKALSLEEGAAINWYNLGQAYLKRAQKVAGIFTYSFKGHYKDVSDFYRALDAMKRAVQMAPDDKVYWQNLSTILELMDKLPMALFCLEKSLVLYEEHSKNIAGSDLLGGSGFEDSSISMIKGKKKELEEKCVEAIDPFDDDAVYLYESRERKKKLEEKRPLNHYELYMEATEYYQSGEMETSKNFLNRSIELKQDFFEAWLLLAEISLSIAIQTEEPELREIEFSNTTRCVEHAIGIRPESIDPYKLLARKHEITNSRDDYIKVLVKIIELQPGNWEYRKRVSEVFFEKGLNFHIYGDSTAADMYLRKSLDMYEYDAETWLWYGMNFLLREDFKEAKEAFKDAMRLQDDYAAAIDGLKEAYYREALDYKAAGMREEALGNIGKIFELDPSNKKASHLQSIILSEYCELGFDQLEERLLDEAKDSFERVLQIQDEYPFAWLGLAFYHFRKGDLDDALECSLTALKQWNENITEYSDEFMMGGALEIFSEIGRVNGQYNEKIEGISEQYMELLSGFMNINRLIHGGRIRFKHLYPNIFKFMMEIATTARAGNDRNLTKFLEKMGADDLGAHLSMLGGWEETRATTDAAKRENRILVLKDMKYFLERFFAMFAFKCDVSLISNVILFINYLLQDFTITIPEMYEIFEFIETGDFLTRAVDILATTMHVADDTLDSGAISLVKTGKAIEHLRVHPHFDIIALVTRDRKLHFINGEFKPVKSYIYAGKIVKGKVNDFQWSPDGMKGIIFENKEQKGLLKNIIQGGSNRITAINFALDPMINPMSDISTIEPEVLEAQITSFDVDKNTLALSWKDDRVFQALLKDGSLIRWTYVGDDIRKQGTRVDLDENYLVKLSSNQTMLAIVNIDSRTTRITDIPSDKVYSGKVPDGIVPLAISWDNQSLVAYLMGKHEHSDDTFSIYRIINHADFEKVVDFSDAGTDPSVFEVLPLANHTCFLTRSPSKFIIVEDSALIKMNLGLDPDLAELLGKENLSYEWRDKAHFRIYFDKPRMGVMDFREKFKALIEARIQFLDQFPRHTFTERADVLRSLYTELS